MVVKKSVEQVFVSYLDDDGTPKNQWVVIIDKDNYGVNFKFKDGSDIIFIPWSRVLKIKEKEVKNE